MSNTTLQAPPAAPAPVPGRNPWGMLWSVLIEPRAVFESLRAKPAWLPPVLVYWVVAMAVGLLAIPKSIDLSLDQVLKQSPGTDPEQLRRMITLTGYITVPISTAIAVAGMSLLVAGILTLLGTMAGGEGSFMQVWSASLYAAVPASVFGALIKGLMVLTTPGSGLKTLSTSLAMLLKPASFGTPLYYALSIFDPFSLWGLALLTIGLAVVLKFPTRKAAFLTVPLWLVGQGLAVAMTALSASRLG